MSGLWNARTVKEKEEAFQLAMAKHLAKEALDKLKAEGVIKSHTMATFGSMGSTLGAYNVYDGEDTVPSPYQIKSNNKFSILFAQVFYRIEDAKNNWSSGAADPGSFMAVGGSMYTAPTTASSVTWSTYGGGAGGSSSWTVSKTMAEQANKSYPTATQQKAFLEGQQAIADIQAQTGFFKRLKSSFTDNV